MRPKFGRTDTSGIVVFAVLTLMSTIPLSGSEFTLTILHTNDLHARYEQTNVNSSPCPQTDVTAGKCFGGFARLKTAVREIRQKHGNTLFLDAGDQYQGTLWFFRYGGNVTSHFMNWLGYDVMALGNHEFDREVVGLMPFLRNVNFSVVSSNIDGSLEPEFQTFVNKSKIVKIGNETVGIIGYTTQETPDISNPGNIKFGDVVTSVRKEAELMTSQGVNKIIALGHAGFTVDKAVAKIPDVDVVVGGHTNTFLYTGTAPSTEQAEGTYPTVVARDDGSNGLVVQDYAYTKYLGVLHLTFSDEGKVTNYSGNPMLLDASVERDNATLIELAPWREGVVGMSKTVIGRTLVRLEGDRKFCRVQECNMGNLIADSMVHQNLKHADDIEWNDVSIALMNGGGVRDSMAKGNITLENVLNVLPFQNTFDAITIKGEYLRAALEYSVSKYTPNVTTDLFGGFLQVSGLRVVYNLYKPVGSRVVTVDAVCTRCDIPAYIPLQNNATYKVILSSFTADGGDGYVVLRDNAIERHLLGDLDSDVLLEYIKSSSPIIQGLEGRIQFMDKPDNDTVSGCTENTTKETNVGCSFFASGSLLFLIFVLPGLLQ